MGNLINNLIESNGGDGASLVVDNGGTLNFGTPGADGTPVGREQITRNTIQANTGAGLRLSSTVSVDGIPAQIDALVQKNTISNNVGGGISSAMFGTGATNFVNLIVGGPSTLPNTSDEDASSALANTIRENSVFGVSFAVAGTGKGNFAMSNSTVSDTRSTGANGDGINLTRSDSSLLTATIENVTATGNARNGLAVNISGSDKANPAQPMSGTVNTVTWNRNNFSDNPGNGASFRR